MAFKACRKCRGELVFQGLNPGFEYVCSDCGSQVTVAHPSELKVRWRHASTNHGTLSARWQHNRPFAGTSDEPRRGAA